MNINIVNIERIVRCVIATALALLVVEIESVAPWLALIATYPFFTGLLGWDPVYALFNSFRNRQLRSNVAAGTAYEVSAG